MTETRLLYYFLIVAQEGNITKAANALHITQPTLSRQMALLEEELGTKLFQRGVRPLLLTDEGMLLRRRAEEILELLRKTEAEISLQEEQIEGTVCIGCGELAAVGLLTDMISEFRKRYPGVVFDMYTANADQIKRRMDNGLTDVGLLLEPVDMEKYEFIRMPVKERWAAVMPASAPLARRARVTAADLAATDLIMPSRQKVYDEVANWFGGLYDALNIAAVSNLSTNAALMVRAGLGYAIVVEGGLPFLNRSEICMVPLYPEINSTSALAWKRAQPFSTPARYFIEHIKCFSGMKPQYKTSIRHNSL